MGSHSAPMALVELLDRPETPDTEAPAKARGSVSPKQKAPANRGFLFF